MMLLALMTLALAPVQTTGGPDREALYAAPVVRPFEPPSTFGRVTAEGDGEGDVRRAPLTAPVAVESYRRSYEYAPSGAETAYDLGVAEAERAMDQRMGPLDGAWKVRDGEGRDLMALVIVDRGEGRPLEGGWRRTDAVGALGALREAGRTAATRDLSLGAARLTLTASAGGWTGVLDDAGRRRAVTLQR